MARPKASDARLTRERVLRHATALFGAQGLSAVTTRAVAEAAGVSLATLHHHFGNKQGLYDACVEAMYESFAGLQAELLSASGETPTEWVRDAVARCYAFAREHREAARLTTRDALEQGRVSLERREQTLLPALRAGAGALAEWTGRDPAGLRLVLRSLSFLVLRYVTLDPDELAAVIGGSQDPAHADPLHAQVERHLADLALLALGLPLAGEPTPQPSSERS